MTNCCSRNLSYAKLLHLRPCVVMQETDGPVDDHEEGRGEREDDVRHQRADHERPPVYKRGLEGGSERAGAYFSSDLRNLFRLLGCTWTTEEEGFLSEIQTLLPLVVFLGLVRTALHEWRETSKKRNIMETIIQMSIILM